MSHFWSITAAAKVFLIFRNRRIGVMVGLVVFSHWILDFMVHMPDLPLFFEGSPLLGWACGAPAPASSMAWL